MSAPFSVAGNCSIVGVAVRYGHVAELVYAYVSEAYGAILGGSSPPVPTMNKRITIIIVCIVLALTVALGAYFLWQGSGRTDLIHISLPKPNSSVSSTSPLTVAGEARGNWYFEASFPVVVVDWDGKIIGQGTAQAQSDWMTDSYVPFKGTIKFEKPSYGTRGAVIFKNDNPSGDPKNAKAVEIPIVFK